MEERLVKVGITHGDINGIGYEVILKTLSDTRIAELCTPVIYEDCRLSPEGLGFACCEFKHHCTG